MDQEMKKDNSIDQINIKLTKNLKKQSQTLFSKLGLTTSGAITLFLKQAVITQSIPFPVSLPHGNISPAANGTEDFSPHEVNDISPANTIQHDVIT